VKTKFDPSDFDFLGNGIEDSVSDAANAKLEEIKAAWRAAIDKDQVYVSGSRIDGEWIISEIICNQTKPNDTHEALLINIREIKPKECEHAWLIPNKNRTTCKKCGRDGYIKLDAAE